MKSEALECFDRAVKLDPDVCTHAHSNRGNALHALGRRAKEALECFDRAVELDPDNALMHYSRGSALHALGKDSRGTRML